MWALFKEAAMANIAGRPARILWLGLLLTGYLMTPALSAPPGKKEHNPAIPLPWLTAEEQSRFETGRALFKFPFTPRDGLGRFGSQAHVGSLFEFVADALRQEIGLTSPVLGFTTETAEVDVPIRIRNRIPQPNVSLDVVNKLVDFISMLAPPERNPTMMTDGQVIRGEQLFKQTACAVCHVPTYRTATTPINRLAQRAPMLDALLNREIHPYSDFSSTTWAVP